MIARYRDVDNAARGNVVGEENGREFDLVRGTGESNQLMFSHFRARDSGCILVSS